MKTKTNLRDVYSRPGFRARARFKCGIQGDPNARVIQLDRRQKKVFAPIVGEAFAHSGTGESTERGTWTPDRFASIWTSNTGAWTARTAA